MPATTAAPRPAAAPRLLPRLARLVDRTAAVFAFAVAMTGHSERSARAMTDVMEAEIRRLKL
ncbi:hypothetical protein C882_3586 [Caenispirillum salinarum AK4]|uniref:Uncharacterized protein n=1 Tax=Caenispirillum salinarum AK4 TaxID=1238182 RepID=K9H434_9PROT|nr:hypothetical protein [Caenispirillum salinarum]EKV31834.1 hypothetical protein C882_3586 [Caenispirillum salinarum AK4]